MRGPQGDYHRYYTGYYGREPELSLFEQVVYKVWNQGGLHGLLFSGSPGIGKSRLLHEIRRIAGNRGAEVAFHRFREGGQVPSNRVWNHLLSQLTHAATGDAPQHNTLDTLFRFLKGLAHHKLVIIFLDNLHAATGPFLNELVEAIEELVREPLLLVMAYQDLPIYRRNAFLEFLSDVSRMPYLAEHRLEPLDVNAARQLVEEIVGIPISDQLLRMVINRSHGNPLFIQEIAQLLRWHGSLMSNKPEEFWHIAVPRKIYTVISRRVQHLSSECRSLINTLSLLPLSFSHEDVICAVPVESQTWFNACLDQAIIHGFISVTGPGQQYTFVHSIIREAFRFHIPLHEKQKMLRQMALQVEAHGTAESEKWAATLSYWWSQAGEDEQARTKSRYYALIAADFACVGRDYTLALEVIQSVFDIDSGPPETKIEADILYKVGQIKTYLSLPIEAMNYYRQAIRYYIEHQYQDNILSLDMHPVNFPIGQPDMADLYPEILASSQCTGVYRAMVLMHYAGTLINNRGDYDHAETILKEAMELCCQHKAERVKMAVLIVSSYVDYIYRRFGIAYSKLKIATSLNRKFNDVHAWPNMCYGKSTILKAIGKIREAADVTPHLVRYTEQSTSSANLFLTYVVATRQYMQSGQWHTAAEYLDRGLNRFPGNSFLLCYHIYLNYIQGNLESGDHVKRYLNSLRSHAQLRPYLLDVHTSIVEVIRALCTDEVHELHKTSSRLRTVVAHPRQHPFIEVRAYMLLCIISELLHDTELAEFAGRGLQGFHRYYLIRPYFRDRALAYAAHCCGNHKTAQLHIDQALESSRFYHDSLMEPVLMYESCRLHINSTDQAADHSHCVELLNDARIKATQLSMQPVLTHIETLLSQLLEEQNKSGALHFHLTARELQVLRLVGKGLSNRAIAETLHISLHTVTNHIRNIIHKSGARNRFSAYVIAKEHHLL